MRKMLGAGLFGLASMVAMVGQAAAAQGDVIASIKPVHSLVAAVMEGVAVPQLIVQGAGSPHTYQMRPSQAAALERARLVFWVGPDLEHFLEQPLETLAAGATIVELEKTPGLTLLPPREGGSFEPEEEDHDHGHVTIDPHLWLDPENAKAMVDEIGKALAKADPKHAAAYEANVKTVKARLDRLERETAEALEPVKGKPFVVFHDAYHYFEHRFGLNAAGSITVDPQVSPGVARLREIREKLTHLQAACVFAEPQFQSSLIRTATEGNNARTGTLDPLGAGLADGPDLYFTLIRNLTDSLVECLAAPAKAE